MAKKPPQRVRLDLNSPEFLDVFKSTVYSVRLSQKIRALAFREGEFMRFISLHPDHDSAYE